MLGAIDDNCEHDADDPDDGADPADELGGPFVADSDARGYEDHASSLRAWLATAPASTTKHDYDLWAAHANDHLRDGALPHVISRAIVEVSGLGWRDCLEVAAGRASYPDLAARRLEERRSGDALNDLVSAVDAAVMLGVGETSVRVHASRPGFPAAVAQLGRTRVWYRADVEAFCEGRPVPERVEGELQADLVTARELAQRFGITVDSLRTKLSERRYDLAPQPAGRVGGNVYGHRDALEAWIDVLPTGRRRYRTISRER